MPRIRLPNNWRPRPYQQPLWNYLEGGGNRAVAVWHRRAGKDDVCLHWTATAAMQRVGTYWHMLPEAAQARKAIWNAVNPHTGKRRVDEAFPPEIRASTQEHEMFIRFANGSTWQVVGSDNYNSLVGSPPIGVVFSEWALADPASWAYLRPIFRENGGWALFIYTPRGRNHGATFFDNAKALPAEWFAERLTARQTPVFTEADLAAELRDYKADYGEQDGESRFNQEYLCDFNAAVVGSYYGSLMNDLETKGRIREVRHEPALSVHTAWDLGIGDSTAIWFCQLAGQEVRLIDYYEASGVGLDHYAAMLRSRSYNYGDHILPHDADISELGTGRTRVQTLGGMGISGRVLTRSSPDDGINAARLLLPKCWFDADKCKRGIEALRQYRREYDDELKAFKKRPLHDWTSHAADAFRYLAMGLPDAWADLKPVDRYAHTPKRGGSWMTA